MNSAEKTQIKAALHYLTTPQTSLKRLSWPRWLFPRHGKLLPGRSRPRPARGKRGDRGTLCLGWSCTGAPEKRGGSGASGCPGQTELGEEPARALSPGNVALRSLRRSETAKKPAPGMGCPSPRGCPRLRGPASPGAAEGTVTPQVGECPCSCPSPSAAGSEGGPHSLHGEPGADCFGDARGPAAPNASARCPTFGTSAAGQGGTRDPSPPHQGPLCRTPTRGRAMGRGATAASRGSASVAGEHQNTAREMLTEVKPGRAGGTVREAAGRPARDPAAAGRGGRALRYQPVLPCAGQVRNEANRRKLPSVRIEEEKGREEPTA